MQVLAIGTGAVVASVTGAAALERAYDGAGLVLGLLVAGAIIGVALLLWPPILRQILRRVASGEPAAGELTFRGILFGVAANTLAWLGYGLAFYLFARGLLPASGLTPRLAIAVFTASYLAGFLALFAPGGIGVREGLFILMLQGPLGISAATALALASRVWLTIAELGSAVPFLAFGRSKMNAPS
jgi:hypothetical protein